MGKVSRHSDLTGRVVRTLSIFGSLEVITMACAIVRTKLVAIWIGAAGVGIISLYNTTLEMLKTVMQLNLRQSAVREIAAADSTRRPLLCSATRRCGLYIGVISSIIVALLSPLLSRLTFDTPAYTWGFAALSVTMFAGAVTSAKSAVLQALGLLRALARASLWAALLSTGAAVPLFYFFRYDAIVPVLLVFPFSAMLFTLLQRDGCDRRTRHVPAELRRSMAAILRLGGWLTLAVGVTLAADYALRIYINARGGLSSVGIFQAGYTVINSYIGIFFTAISMEFFPRLSATVSRRRITDVVMGHEITVVSWLLLPVVIIFLAADRLIVDILYSSDFRAALPYMNVAIVATLLRGSSWCMAYMIMARGDGRAYVVTEILSAAVMLGSAIPLYNTMGFEGLGLAYLIQYVFYAALTWSVCRRRYGLRLSPAVGRLIVGAPLIAAGALFLKSVAWWAPLLILPLLVRPTLKALR